MRPPTIEELDDLGSYLRLTVPPEYEDLNKHVTVTQHYLMLARGASAMWRQDFGLNEARAARGEGSFALEQHLQFHREIMVGDEVSVHVRVLDRSPKVFHTMMILANRTTGQVASTNEALDAFIDLRARRVAPMPQDLADRLDLFIEKQRELSWQLPLSKKIEIRR